LFAIKEYLTAVPVPAAEIMLSDLLAAKARCFGI
jgi:hypothetical protein